jgi:hypothetical protein
MLMKKLIVLLNIVATFLLVACEPVSPSSTNPVQDSSPEVTMPTEETSEESKSIDNLGLIFDYYCNVSQTGNWVQCDEETRTVKNLANFDIEITYYDRFKIYEMVWRNGERHVYDLSNSTIKATLGNVYYNTDFLYKRSSGNASREYADYFIGHFDNFLDSFLPFAFDLIEEHYGTILMVSDFNPNWSELENLVDVPYRTPEEVTYDELQEAIKLVVISDISYYRSSAEYVDGSYRITNNTGRNIDNIDLQVLYYDYNNNIIFSQFGIQGTLFDNASTTKSLFNRIQGFSFSDIAYIDVIITNIRFLN